MYRRQKASVLQIKHQILYYKNTLLIRKDEAVFLKLIDFLFWSVLFDARAE